MSGSNGRAFNEWLRGELRAKKMSQRQLAQSSGVDHSTISRLVRGDRMPSLGTATKLARGLRELRDEDDGPQYLSLVTAPTQSPTARIEYALRADDALSEAQVRQVMEYYLAVRMRHLARGAVESRPLHLAPVRRDFLDGHPANGHPVALGSRLTMTVQESAPTRRPLRTRDRY